MLVNLIFFSIFAIQLALIIWLLFLILHEIEELEHHRRCH